MSDLPIRLFHGEADDWTLVRACRDYVERLRRAAQDAGARQLSRRLSPVRFASGAAPVLWIPNVQRGPTCDIEERPGARWCRPALESCSPCFIRALSA